MMQEEPVSADGGVAEEQIVDESWAQLEEAPIAADEDVSCVTCDDLVQDDEGEASQSHRALPEPTQLDSLALPKLVSLVRHGSA